MAKSSRVETSGNPFAVTSIPRGKSGREWKFDDERVRKIAWCQPFMRWEDLFFDDEDVSCVDVDSFDVLYVRDEKILLLARLELGRTMHDRAGMISGLCFISNVM